MDTNPYQPPSAPVKDVARQRAVSERPDQVWTAVVLLWLSIVVGLVLAAIQWKYITSVSSPSVVVLVQIAGLAFFGWLYFKIWHGRNWARIVQLVLTVIGLPFSLMQFPELYQRTPTGALITGVQLFMKLSALYLIFISPGRIWFKYVEVMPNQPLNAIAPKDGAPH
jgi:hypothetical protein